MFIAFPFVKKGHTSATNHITSDADKLIDCVPPR